MQQYCLLVEEDLRDLPDRYVEGQCPVCSSDGARGDQCDSCGATYEANELINPRSKLDSESEIEIRDTDHFFLRLGDFQDSLEKHASERKGVWKPNVRAMTKNWLDMGLRSRAVTRDIEGHLHTLKEKIGDQREFMFGLKHKDITPVLGYGPRVRKNAASRWRKRMGEMVEGF